MSACFSGSNLPAPQSDVRRGTQGREQGDGSKDEGRGAHRAWKTATHGSRINAKGT